MGPGRHCKKTFARPESPSAAVVKYRLSAYSGIATAVTQAVVITFVQANAAVPQTPQPSVAVPFTSAQAAGDLNVVAVGWSDSTTQVQSVTDTTGNPYVRAVGPTLQSGIESASLYYAANIAAAQAGSNTVTVAFNASAPYPDVRIAEYSGVAAANPVDVTAAAQGTGTSSNSGAATTTNPTDLLVGANVVKTSTNGAGASFTNRVTTSPDGDILEDRVVTTVGSYSATAPLNASGAWIMQLVAFPIRVAACPPCACIFSTSPSCRNR